MPDVTTDDFRLSLNKMHLRPLGLVYIALAVGVVVVAFVFLLVILNDRAPEPSEADFAVVRILTLLALLMTAALAPVSGLLYRRLLAGQGPVSSPDAAIGRIRTATIVRAGLLEGAALFGAVVFLLSGLWGVLHTDSIYWVNLLPALFFLGFVALTFPTRDRIEEVFRTRVRSRR